jgi:hypothetical protein
MVGAIGAVAATAAFASPASAALSFTVPASVNEGNAIEVVVTRPLGENAVNPLDATVQALSGTAKAGEDFDAAPRTVHFKAMELSAKVTISTVEDTMDEDPETFDVVVDSDRINDPKPKTVTINDDDDAPAVSLVGNLSAPEGTGSSPTPFTFTLKVSKLSGRTIKVPYTVYDGSAIEPEDFTNGKATAVIPAGSETAPLTVPVVADNVDEFDEKFTVELGNPDHGSVGDGTSSGTIVNDDVPVISVGDVRRKEGNSGPTALLFPVTLSNRSSAREITVDYSTAASSDGAKSPDDFAADKGTLTFTKGETSESFIVWAKGDTTWEPDESFVVTLSNPDGGTLARYFVTGTIENDDPVPPPSPAPAPKPTTTTSVTARTPLQPTVVGAGGSTSTSTTTRTTTRMGATAPVFVRPARVRTSLTCPTAARTCRGTVSVFTVPTRNAKIRALRGEMKVGTIQFIAQGGQRRTFTMKVPPRILALLRQAGSIRVRAYVVARDSRGRIMTTQVLGTLRRA